MLYDVPILPGIRFISRPNNNWAEKNAYGQVGNTKNPRNQIGSGPYNSLSDVYINDNPSLSDGETVAPTTSLWDTVTSDISSGFSNLWASAVNSTTSAAGDKVAGITSGWSTPNVPANPAQPVVIPIGSGISLPTTVAGIPLNTVLIGGAAILAAVLLSRRGR